MIVVKICHPLEPMKSYSTTNGLTKVTVRPTYCLSQDSRVVDGLTAVCRRHNTGVSKSYPVYHPIDLSQVAHVSPGGPAIPAVLFLDALSVFAAVAAAYIKPSCTSSVPPRTFRSSCLTRLDVDGHKRYDC